MSGRNYTRFALTALLTAALAAPAGAQDAAPQPRAGEGAVIGVGGAQAGLGIGSMPHTLNFEALRAGLDLPAVAPMPRAKAQTGRIEIELQFDLTGAGALHPVVPPMATPTPPMLLPVAPAASGPLAVVRPACCPETTGGIGCGLPRRDLGHILRSPFQPMVGGVLGCGGFQHGTSPRVIQLHTFEAPRSGVVTVTSVASAHQANPLVGTWYRDAGVAHTVATFTHDEMKLSLTPRAGSAGGKGATVTVTAHYTLTKDGLVYGAVTSADIDAKGTGDEEMLAAVHALADRPFSFRVKHTSEGMMVSGLKFSTFDCGDDKDAQVFGGLFKCAPDGKVPTATAGKVGKCDSGYGIVDVVIAAPTAPYAVVPPCVKVGSATCERVGIDFTVLPTVPPTSGGALAPAQWTVIAPPAVAPPCPAPPVARPFDPMKHMAGDVFGQLLQQNGVLPAPACPAPVPFSVALEPAPAKTGIAGTWHRQMGTAKCVITIDGDHMTMTVSQTGEKGGKTICTHLTLTAEYRVTRDGTAVGLITSVDAKLDGASDQESADVMNTIAEFQKALEDKPFAMSCRKVGDALVIGNVRMPGNDHIPVAMIGGRYTSGEGKAATKTAGACDTNGAALTRGWTGTMTLPSPRYLDHYPRYIAPDPTFPLPRELANMEDPEVRPAGGITLPLAVCPSAALGCAFPRCAGAVESSVPPTPAPLPPTMPAPVPPTFPVPQPIPPATTGFVLPTDPNVKMQRLLYNNEGELRQYRNEWRRFWFNDQPSHLTPERVHGGIY